MIGTSSGNAANRLTVNGSLGVPGTLNVGFDGSSNRLGVVSSGSVSAGGLWIGGLASSASNTVTVLAAGPLTVGRASSGNVFEVTSGTLTVTGTVNDVIVGDDAAAGGNGILVTGGSFSSQAALVIGKSGTGNTFSATVGAKVSNTNVRFGLNASSTGNAGTVDGAGTVWTITNKLRVGSDGAGNSLAITGGGVVNVASDVFVGGTDSSSNVSGNSITLSGSGSTLAILSGTADLVIAYGSGTANVVTVTDGGSLSVSSVKLGPGGRCRSAREQPPARSPTSPPSTRPSGGTSCSITRRPATPSPIPCWGRSG